VARYLRLFGVQARSALLLSMQYRLDFFVEAVMALFWTASALAPLFVLFRMRSGVAGWNWAEALIVVGFFTMLKGFLSGVVQPALTTVVEHLRTGTLDFLLLKPVDAQFMVSTCRLDLARVVDVGAGVAIAAFGFARSDRALTLTALPLTLLLLACAVVILYGIWLLAVSVAFHVVKIDNLSNLIVSTYDAARWPSSVFRGVFAFVFTFIIPLALMTTYPALALLGRISAAQVLASVGTALAFLALSRFVWLRSVGKYTSAGG
jgi:ABC-2 type transport system permease protein